MLKMNEDCLLHIFEELRDDTGSLHSCLLVNKLWSEIVVSILWEDPWKFLNSFKDHKEKLSLLLNTIFLHLSEETKNNLRDLGIKIPQQQKNPLYNYIEFIKCIRKIHQKFHIFESSNNPFFNNYDLKFTLEQEIYKLLIVKCTSLKFLDINDIKHPLYKYPEAAANLSRIDELHCKSYDDEKLLYELSNICRSIKKLCISYESSNLGLAKLIEMQKNLKYIKILVNFKGTTELMKYEDKDKCQEIDRAIVKHSNNLIYLDIPIESIGLSFYNKLFPQLKNLQKFILDGNNMFGKTELENQLFFSTYSKLQVLDLDGVSFSTAKRIIQNTENLQIIWTNKICFNTADQSRDFIETIYQNCPHLRYVKFLLKGQYFEKIEQLLKRCKSLEGLYIDLDHRINNRHGDELLNILIRSAPDSLFKIQLNHFEFKTKNLDLFFIKWRRQKPLWLYLDKINDEFKDLVEKYEKEGVIKKCESNGRLNFIDDYKEL